MPPSGETADPQYSRNSQKRLLLSTTIFAPDSALIHVTLSICFPLIGLGYGLASHSPLARRSSSALRPHFRSYCLARWTRGFYRGFCTLAQGSACSLYNSHGVHSESMPLKRRYSHPITHGLSAVIAFGGIIGPLLLLFGLNATIASYGALLLNLEGLATMAIAWLVFRENVDNRLLIGAFAILRAQRSSAIARATVRWVPQRVRAL